MELADWQKEPGFNTACLPDGTKYAYVTEYDGRKLPTFENNFVARMEEIRKNFVSKEGDIFIYGYMKSGTHWVWEIARMILEDDDSVSESYSKNDSFLESVTLEAINSLPSPRILSSHLMPSGLPTSIFDNSKVIVPIRHPKDAAVSLYHHLAGETKGTNLCCGWNTFITDVWFNPELAFYASWAEFTSEVWHQCRVKENYLPIIYEQLLENPVEMIRDLANFLDKGLLTDDRLQKIADATNFSNMKQKKKQSEKHLETTFEAGYSMFRKGIKGDWKSHFTKEQNDMFDEKMKALCENDAMLRQVMLLFDDN